MLTTGAERGKAARQQWATLSWADVTGRRD